MEKVLTLSTTMKHLENSLLSGAEKNSGECYILVGKEGNGKSEILSILEARFAKKGFRIFRSKTYSSEEVLKYQPFNEILNQMQSTFINRDSDQIINEIHEYLSKNNDGKTILVVERLERMSEATRSFFMFVSKLSQRFNFTVIGTYSTPDWSREETAETFLDLVSSEEHFIIISVKKPTLEDLKYVLRLRGYRLPESFIIDLHRLVNGDINTLKYVLRYYQEQGIIKDNKEIDEVTYRFFPIPPTVEIYYEKMLSGLGDTDLQVLELLAMLGEDLNPELISQLLRIKKDEVLGALASLEKAGVVAENNDVFKIRNIKLVDHILKKMTSSRKMAISTSVINNNIFEMLPLKARMNLLEKNRNYDIIEGIVKRDWKQLPEKFTSQSDLVGFLRKVLPHIKDRNTRKIAELVICNSLFISGDPEEAKECYESHDFSEIDPVMPDVNLASIYSSMSNYEKSDEIISRLLSCESLKEDQRAIVMTYKGQNLVMQRMYDDAYKVTMDSISISEKLGLKEILATAYNVIGTIKTENAEYATAMDYYNKSYELNLGLGLRHKLASNLNNIAIIKSYFGDFESSIGMLTELIENSYITGDLISRAYATYNLSEIYSIIGKREESYYYIPTASKLVELSRTINLKYLYNRFLALFLFQSLELEKAVLALDEAIDAAKAGGHKNWEDIAMAFKGVLLELQGKNAGDEYRELYLKEYDPYDEFSPLYYVIVANAMILKNDREGFRKAIDLAENSAEKSGDYYGKLSVIMHKSMSLLITGHHDEVRKYLENAPEPNTPVPKYNLLVKFVKESLMELDGQGTAELDVNVFMRNSDGAFYEYENYVIIMLITLAELLVLKRGDNFKLLMDMMPQQQKSIIESYVSKLKENGL